MDLELPIITLRYLALLALFYAALTMFVAHLRIRLRVGFGDGGQQLLARAVRAHGNLSECLPVAILVIGTVEALGLNRGLVHAALLLFVATRLSHVYAMFDLAPPSRRYLFARVFGAAGTWFVVAASAVALAVLAFGVS